MRCDEANEQFAASLRLREAGLIELEAARLKCFAPSGRMS